MTPSTIVFLDCFKHKLFWTKHEIFYSEIRNKIKNCDDHMFVAIFNTDFFAAFEQEL